MLKDNYKIVIKIYIATLVLKIALLKVRSKIFLKVLKKINFQKVAVLKVRFVKS